MSAIPVVLCGKSPTMAQAFTKALGSDYDVLHVLHSTDAGLRELPALLRGEPVRPASGLGSNVNTPSRQTVPRAIIVGKGFSQDEVETLRRCDGADKVPWLVPDDAQMTWTRIAKVAATAGTALPGIVAQRVDACMKEHGLVPGKDKEVEGGTWTF